jgi:putative oxidoreductase
VAHCPESFQGPLIRGADHKGEGRQGHCSSPAHVTRFQHAVQKSLYPEALGAGRFAEIGIPAPGVVGWFVGTVETACGALLLVGLFSRLAAIQLLVDISAAILSTKIPILAGHGFWTYTLAKLPRYGFLSMTHEARTDFSMLLGLIFLVIMGAGAWSLDAMFARGRMNREAAKTNAPIIGGQR